MGTWRRPLSFLEEGRPDHTVMAALWDLSLGWSQPSHARALTETAIVSEWGACYTATETNADGGPGRASLGAERHMETLRCCWTYQSGGQERRWAGDGRVGAGNTYMGCRATWSREQWLQRGRKRGSDPGLGAPGRCFQLLCLSDLCLILSFCSIFGLTYNIFLSLSGTSAQFEVFSVWFQCTVLDTRPWQVGQWGWVWKSSCHVLIGRF